MGKGDIYLSPLLWFLGFNFREVWLSSMEGLGLCGFCTFAYR